MSEFYVNTGGVTLLVITHRGDTFDYVNGSKGQRYFEKWTPLLSFMEIGKTYVVGCRVYLNGSKCSLYPFGIALEVTEDEGRRVSLEHVLEVNSGRWDAESQYLALHADWQLFKQRAVERLQHRLDSAAPKNRRFII